jgi:hypothetical protein
MAFDLRPKDYAEAYVEPVLTEAAQILSNPLYN